MDYIEEPLRKYVEDTASGVSTPGGGSVSALVGALGTAITSMVSHFTIGRDGFANVELKVKEILGKCDDRRLELLSLMNEDVHSYDKVSEAYSLPKSTKDEKTARSKAIQDALHKAMYTPLKTVRCCLSVLVDIRSLAEIANPNLISDVGVAALFTNAALLGGKLNVDINLAAIKDDELVHEIDKEVKEAELRAFTLLNDTIGVVRSKIKNR